MVLDRSVFLLLLFYLKLESIYIPQLSYFLVFEFMEQICHRDLKLENTLLDGSPAPRLKICDFGYSKVYTLMLVLAYFY